MRGNRHPDKAQRNRNQKPNKNMPRRLRRHTERPHPLVGCQVIPDPPKYDPGNCEQCHGHPQSNFTTRKTEVISAGGDGHMGCYYVDRWRAYTFESVRRMRGVFVLSQCLHLPQARSVNPAAMAAKKAMLPTRSPSRPNPHCRRKSPRLPA
jgi:hypothetical protein